MDIWEAMRSRHSVRQFRSKPIEEDASEAMRQAVATAAAASGLKIVLCLDEPNAFQANKPSYGSFKNCANYIILAGPKGVDETVGYFGEQLVLFAQQLGLNTCWVALTYEKSAPPIELSGGEKIYDLIALGYGASAGVAHRNKPLSRVAKLAKDDPEWYRQGLEAAMLAPTAINQQRFRIERVGERGVRAKALLGPCSKTDLGIVKYHFELGAGKENFDWL